MRLLIMQYATDNFIDTFYDRIALLIMSSKCDNRCWVFGFRHLLSHVQAAILSSVTRSMLVCA